MTLSTARFLCLLFLVSSVFAGDTVRPGLESLAGEADCSNPIERRLIQTLKAPLLQGLDVVHPLTKWFQGRLLHTQGNVHDAQLAWQQGLRQCQGLKPLPKPHWGPLPQAELTVLETINPKNYPDFQWEIVQWRIQGLRQYGVVIRPRSLAPDIRYPVILYTHGAAFGIPSDFLPWLTELASRGYVIAAPAMRGEPLFQRNIRIGGRRLTCEGEIENLEGEVDDCLSLLAGVWKRSYVRKGEFAVLGHSFGAGVGILTALRAGPLCKAIVSYDAWLVNPQRYYWDRMSRGANNWLSWEDFCNQPVDKQLAGLMTRSAVHNAERLKAQGLFFIGGAYAGSVFHLSYDDFFKELKRLHIPYTYHVMPKAGHNFLLYTHSVAARKALKIQNAFLDRHFPPQSK